MDPSTEALIVVPSCIVGSLLLWALPIFLGVREAERKGHSPHWMWFGLHPVGGWIAYLILKFGAQPRRLCPACREKVPIKASRCPFCTEDLTKLDSLAIPPDFVDRNRSIILPILGILFIVGMAGGVWAIYRDLSSTDWKAGGIRTTAPYLEAMSRVQRSQTVAEKLGIPILDSAGGSTITTSADGTGSCEIKIILKGSKGTGSLRVIGQQQAGIWRYQVMEVLPDDGTERIDLREVNAK